MLIGRKRNTHKNKTAQKELILEFGSDVISAEGLLIKKIKSNCISE